jgi:N-methylhydantoinase B/oxoprolinase/acetone carboxylase alpha subunit
MRAALRALPDGRAECVDALDDGTPVVVAATVAGDEITFDFSGCGAQQVGNLNAVRAVTVSAVAFALRSATDPTIPANGGTLAPVRIVTEPGTVVDARFPAAVAAGNVEVSQRVADVCLGALAWFAPDRIGAASQGTMNNLLLGGTGADGDAWVYYETIGGGQGGRPGAPGHAGMSGVHTAMTNTRDTPVEALEREYPLRVRRYGLRRGSGGAGSGPGGEGIVKEIEVLGPTTCTLITQRRTRVPFGVGGGADGAPGENWWLPGGDETRAVRLAPSVTVDLAPGDVVRILTPGGGGWGPES